jgi:hypothetical protein
MLAVDKEEHFHRVGLGTDDAGRCSGAAPCVRGVEFVESKGVHVEDKGALAWHLVELAGL